MPHSIRLTLTLRPALRAAPADALLRARGLQAGGHTQRLIANEAVQRMRRFTPQRTGTLARSAQAAPDGRSIRQAAPYARRVYYAPARGSGAQTHQWFRVMKQNGGASAILRLARRASGAR